jgi:glycosyltransferase involved in cell wall biosynthesis
MKSVLFLPSWYPSRLDAFTGDFIQRHAIALSLFLPVHVVFIVRDKKKIVTDSVKIEEAKIGNLTETIIYYSCKNYKLGIADRLMSMHKFNLIYQDYFSKKITENEKPTAVHVHVPYKAGLIALWLKNRYNLEYNVTEHWTGYDKSTKDNFYSRPPSFRYITRKILRNAKYIVPVSKDLAEKLNSIVPGIMINIIPNAVNEKLFYIETKEPKTFRFIHYVSSLKGQKNTEGLIKVFSELKKIRQDWECIMYGPADQELSKLVITGGLEKKIKFTGEISYAEVAKIVRSASAFVSFSNYENQPCSILEALCCGVPVIATNVGGIPEIINSQNGILIEPKNELQLFHAVERIMEEYKNYNRQAIAEDSKNKFSFSAVGKQLSLLYTSYFK